MKLSELIVEERNKRGWSQRELARHLRVSPSAVAQWEGEDTKPKLKHALEMFRIFEIALDELTKPGSPYFGQIVDDAEELALLSLWRRLEANDRGVVLRLLRGAGLDPAVPNDAAARRSGKKGDV